MLTLKQFSGWLKTWWENRKGVILDFVLPKLDLAIDPFTEFLKSRGMSETDAKIAAIEAIEWVQGYLKRQL
jgi:hypothetical protein